MKTLSYKGYQASVEFDDGSLFVKVMHINDVLVGECEAASEAMPLFQRMIEEYLQDCQELGLTPSKSFNGSFNVRIDPDDHRRAAIAAVESGMTLNKWVAKAVTSQLSPK